MNKTLLSLAIALFVSVTIHATNIDRQQASQLARDFMSKNFRISRTRQAQTVPLDTVETGQSLVYAFNVEGGGFVVVAGDDCAPAILGYSESSEIDPSDMPEAMKELFAQYQAEMQMMIKGGMRAASIPNLGSKISPLMECKWGQGAPYNYMCPKYYKIDREKRVKRMTNSLTGCYATAMAQIMYYHKHPAEITELPGKYYNLKKKAEVDGINVSKTLEWDKMLPTYGKRNDPQGTQEQQNAVAKLMRLVGQAICMAYTPTASGAYDASVFTGFVKYFNYDASTIKHIQRDRYSYSEWIKTIYEELANKRPVFYMGGSNTSGHGYVVDGYSHEDFFYINWGWNGNSDDAFRLALCNPSKKYEGGGTGDAGYSARQAAIIGIQPATSPQKKDDALMGYNKLFGKISYQRESDDQDFNITSCLSQFVGNYSHFDKSFDYGAVVLDAEGKEVQKLLPLGSKYKNLKLDAGRSVNFSRAPLKIGASLGDGNYSLRFLYRIGEGGEWVPCVPSHDVKFKIKGNTLYFDAKPDWLTVNMDIKKGENSDDGQVYDVKVTLKNESSDKTFDRSIRLGRDDKYKTYDNYGFATIVEPGETKTYNLKYVPNDYMPSKLYLFSYEDCVPLGEGFTTGAGYKSNGAAFKGSCNLDKDLKQKADQYYELKADNSYEVIYTIENTGTDDFYGYVELNDSVGTMFTMDDFEEEDANGEVISLKPGESKDLKLTIYDEGDETTMHEVSLSFYDDNDQPVALYETKPFYFKPLFELSFTNPSITPTEAVDNDLADYIVKGDQMTISGKINNPEDTDFTGTILVQRYVTDFSKDPEFDDEDLVVATPDQVYTQEVIIPAKGSIDFTELFDLKNLVTDKNYSVVVDFDISYTSKTAIIDLPLFISDFYLLNDGTSTSISGISMPRRHSEAIYDLQGRRINGKPTRGIYIKDRRKVVVRP